MELPLTYYGKPVLRKKCIRVEEINDEIKRLVGDMIDTMRTCNGIGLAAPQVNQSLAIFVTEVPIPVKKIGKGSSDKNEEEHVEWESGKVRVFINPKILKYSDEQWTQDEGCLSIPGLYAPVTRPVTITVQATDLDGKVFEEEFSWLDARAIMHENDHINGTLFIDRIHGKLRKELEAKLNTIKKKFFKD